MRLQQDSNFTTLSWVKPELDETLRLARQALETYVESGAERGQMQVCVAQLHQVQGTLRMVELYGAAMVAEEMEQLANALLGEGVSNREEAYGALMRSIMQLPDYLERLQSGHKDIPMVLLPLLNDLRGARGEKVVPESVLFSVDLGRELPAAAGLAPTALSDAKLRAAIEPIRESFQSALLPWLRDEERPDNIAALRDACSKLVGLVNADPARKLFWVAAGTLDALHSGAFAASKPLKQALAKLEREIKRLGDEGETAFAAAPPIELTRQLLYYVASAPTDDARMVAIRDAFGLDREQLDENELAHARGSLTGHNRELLDTVSAGIKEDLLRVKEALDMHLRTSGAPVADLAPQADALGAIADTLGMLGLGVPRKVVQDQRTAIQALSSGQRVADEGALMDIAGSLLYVEASLDDQVARLGQPSDGQSQDAAAMPLRESQQALDALIKESVANFVQARQCFVAFIEAGWDHAQLHDVPRLLDEVSGAMHLLEQVRAARQLHALSVFTQIELVQLQRVPDAAQMDRLADALASLEYYLEALRDHRPQRDRILELAEHGLVALGYWPVPAAAEQALVDAARRKDAPAAAVPEAAEAALVAPQEEAAAAAVEPVASESAAAPSMAAAPAPATTSTPKTGYGFASNAEIDDDIREVFVEELDEEVDNLNQLYATWSAAPGNSDVLRPLRRVFHTLKGSGRLVGALELGEFSWHVESMLNRVLDGSRPASPAVVAIVGHAAQTLPQFRAALMGTGDVTADIEGIKAYADRVAAGEEVFYTPAQAVAAHVETTPETAAVEAPAPVEEATAPAQEEAISGSAYASVDPILLEILRAEVGAHLQTIQQWSAANAASAQPATDALLRAVHTVSGAFAMTEVPLITDVLSPTEGYIRRLLAHHELPSAEGVALLHDVAQAIDGVLDALQHPQPLIAPQAALAERAIALRDALPEPTTPTMPAHLEEYEEQLLSAAPDAAVAQEAERLAAEQAEAERVAAEHAEAERVAAEHAEAERVAAEQAEAERVAAEHAEAERVAAEHAEAERLAAEQAEAERVAAEHAEAERIAAEHAESERIAAEHAEAERVAAEHAEAERIAAEHAESERIAAEHAEAERASAQAEAERLEYEKLEAEYAEADRLAAEQPAEAERAATQHVEPEHAEAERIEAERAAAEQAEAERVAAEKAEAERVAAEQETQRVAAEQAEAERIAAEQEAQRVAAEQAEAERIAAEREEAERIAVENAEAERVAAEQAEAERIAAEKAEAERIAAEQAEAARAAAEKPLVGKAAKKAAAAEKAAAEKEASERAATEALGAEVAHAATAKPSRAYVPSTVEADPDEPLDLSDIDPELLDIFLEETTDILDHSDGLLTRLRGAPSEREPVVGLQRDLHTLKGGARMSGIMSMGELAHAMEYLLEGVAEQRIEFDAHGLGMLEHGFDRLHGMLARIQHRQAVALPEQLIAEFTALARGEVVRAPAPAQAATPTETPAPSVPAEPIETTAEAAPIEPAESAETVEGDEPATAQPARAKPALKPLSAPAEVGFDEEDDIGVRAPQEQVRIRADLLDRLVNYAGEVAIYRARLEQQLGTFRTHLDELDQTTNRLRTQLRKLEIETEAQISARYQRAGDGEEDFDPLELDRFSTQQQLTRALAESAADMTSLHVSLDDVTRQYETLLLQQSRVSSELQDGLMRTRMVPFDALVPRLRRVVRQTASETGKQIQLKVEGAQGEMDRNVLDRMTAPLEHMLRNSAVHGLETPQARREAGKPEEGTVTVSMHREGSEVVMLVSDDGRGLDRDAIRRKAIDRGLLKADAEVSDNALYAFILESGFSTAENVSRLAGRGVGMDVVHNEIRQLGGSLQLQSTAGKGTQFTIRLPFTLAVTQAALVKIGETSFAVPISSVQGVGRIARADLEKQLASETPVYVYAGEEYAIHDLGRLLGVAPAKAQGSLQMPLLLSRSGDVRAAICVDEVLGSREIVVKPVGPQVSSIPGIFGATIMGDGGVMVILDVVPLVRRAAAQALEPVAPVAVVAAPEVRRIPLVMVVDDSITMRKVTGRVLERNNMEVLAAKDGVDAIEKMVDTVPDLMLLDIEMPRMDGYELATHMRNDPRLRDVPIVMITSRTGEKHRQRAFEIGVNRYLGKPYQEVELMRNVFELLAPVHNDG